MGNLASRYLALELAHPIIAAASPLTATFDGMRRLEDAQAAAVVMASLYEEQVRTEDSAYAMFTEYTAHSNSEAATFFPELPNYRFGVSGHLETLRRAAEALDIPVIASLNGVSDDGWLDYAVQLEQADAAALELNLYLLPTDLAVSGQQIEHRYLDIVRHVKRKARIPVSVKLPAFFSAHRQFRRSTRIDRRRRGGAVQSLLPARFRSGDAEPQTRRGAVDSRRYPPASHLDRIVVAAPQPVTRRGHGR